MIIIKFLYIFFDVISYIAYTIDNVAIDVHITNYFEYFCIPLATQIIQQILQLQMRILIVYIQILSFYLIYRSYNIYMIQLSMRITLVSLYTLLYNQRLAQKSFIKDIFKNKPKGQSPIMRIFGIFKALNTIWLFRVKNLFFLSLLPFLMSTPFLTFHM